VALPSRAGMSTDDREWSAHHAVSPAIIGLNYYVTSLPPPLAQKRTGSAIDSRTTRHPGSAVSRRKRKLIEQVFG
jgi:hypothetical protein